MYARHKKLNFHYYRPWPARTAVHCFAFAIGCQGPSEIAFQTGSFLQGRVGGNSGDRACEAEVRCDSSNINQISHLTSDACMKAENCIFSFAGHPAAYGRRKLHLARGCSNRVVLPAKYFPQFSFAYLFFQAVIMGSVLAKASVPVMHVKCSASLLFDLAVAVQMRLEVAASVVRLCAPHPALV